jgi:hypothetical protein
MLLDPALATLSRWTDATGFRPGWLFGTHV